MKPALVRIPIPATDLDCDLDSGAHDDAWDRYVADHAQPHPEQLTAWGDVQRIRGWEPTRIVLRRDGRIVGGAQILHRSARGLGRVAYLNRGPLVDARDAVTSVAILEALKAVGRRLRLRFLTVALPYEGSPSQRELTDAGFMIKPHKLPPRTTEQATIVVDLVPPLEAILDRMRTTTRRYVRQGEKRGLIVREGTEADLEIFGELLLKLCARRGVTPNVPTGEFLHALWRAFAPRGLIHLTLTEFQGEVVGALIVLTVGAWARAWRVGWSGEHGDARPNEVIYWHAMKAARAGGYRYFDFMGFDTEAARALAEGREIPQTETTSLALFKLGLGGEPRLLRPGYCYFFNPALRWILSRWSSRRVGSSGSASRQLGH